MRKASLKQVGYIETLVKQTNRKEYLNDLNKITEDIASIRIEELQKIKAKQEVYYATDVQMKTLVNMCKNLNIFKAFKEECLSLPEAVERKRGEALERILVIERLQDIETLKVKYQEITEQLETELDKPNNDKMIDRLEKLQDELMIEIKISRGLQDNPKMLETLKNRVTKIDMLESELTEYVTSVKSWLHIKDIRLNNDIVRDFCANHGKEYDNWMKNKASIDTCSTLKMLELRLNGKDASIDYIETLTQKQADRQIQQLNKEQKTKYHNYMTEIARTYKGYKGDEYISEKEVAWKIENNKQWNDLTHHIELLTGHEINVSEGDFEELKKHIQIAKELKIDLYEIVDEIKKSSYPITPEELNILGLATEKDIYDFSIQVEETKTRLQKMINLGLIKKEDVLKMFN